MAESELGPHSQHLIGDAGDEGDEPVLKKLKIEESLVPSESVINLGHLSSISSDVAEVGSGLMPYSRIGEDAEEEEGHVAGGPEEQTVLVHTTPSDLLVDSDGSMLINSAQDMVEPSLVNDAKLDGTLTEENQCNMLPISSGAQFANVNGQMMQIVQFQDSESPCAQLVSNGYKVYQLVQTQQPKVEPIYALNSNGEIEIINSNKTDASMLGVGEMGILTNSTAGVTGQSNATRFITIAPQRLGHLPDDIPAWAQKLQDCQKIGKAYRGWVETEVELDFLLTLHKQQTQSFWGTRQSPCPSKPSSRLMWKSQYVPFDGVPFVNSGSRAMVMECQYGPRRKGGTALAKRLEGSSKGDFRQTCPARIYVKKIIKFPQYQVDPTLDKKSLHAAMAKAFQMLKETGLSASGIERYYVELPVESAHEFHVDLPASIPTQCDAPMRLDTRVSQRVRDIVSAGETRLYVIRKALRRFVEKELFDGQDDLPPKHDLSYYPTVNDLQNHIHHAIKDIESGRLPLTASTVNVDIVATDDLRKALRDDSQGDMSHLGAASDRSPETVTVTLTQNPDQHGEHVISRVETHMSDGTTLISTSLNEETAKLLARLHPKMFSTANLIRFDRSSKDDEESFHSSQLLNLQSESLQTDSVFLEAEDQVNEEDLSYTVVVDDSHLNDIVQMEGVKSEDAATLNLAQSEVHLET